MPFKSQAQRRKFAEMMVKGEISPEVFEEWNRETGSRKLPERVGSNKARKATRKGARKSTRKRAIRTARKRARKRVRKTAVKSARKSSRKR